MGVLCVIDNTILKYNRWIKNEIGLNITGNVFSSLEDLLMFLILMYLNKGDIKNKSNKLVIKMEDDTDKTLMLIVITDLNRFGINDWTKYFVVNEEEFIILNDFIFKYNKEIRDILIKFKTDNKIKLNNNVLLEKLVEKINYSFEINGDEDYIINEEKNKSLNWWKKMFRLMKN